MNLVDKYMNSVAYTFLLIKIKSDNYPQLLKTPYTINNDFNLDNTYYINQPTCFHVDVSENSYLLKSSY